MVKVRKSWKRALASVMTFAMLLTSVYTMPVSAEETVTSGETTTVSGNTISSGNANGTTNNTEGNTVTYVLDTADLPTVAQNSVADGDKLEGVGDSARFTIIYGSGSSIDENNKTFGDEMVCTKRVNFRTNASTAKGSIMFETNSTATMKIWWISGGDGRQMTILDETGAPVATTAVESVKNSQYISELSIPTAGTYYLGGDTNSNYIYRLELTEEAEESNLQEVTQVTTTEYNFEDGSIVPTTTDGKATVTSADGKLTVACGPNNTYAYNGGNHGCLFKTNNTITINVPEKAKIEIGGCSYTKDDATITFSMDGTDLSTISTKTATCYHQDGAVVTYDYEGIAGDLVITFTGQTYVPVIKVTRTEIKPEKTELTANVTINDANSLLGDSKVTFVNSSDATDVVDVTDGGSFTLKVNATYNIVTDNSDIAATVRTLSKVVTGTDDLDITVDIASTVINPVVTIVDAQNVLGDATITLTNNAVATEVHTLENGKSVKLSIGASYLVATSDAAVVATIAGSKLYKAVDGVEALEVVVAELDTTHHTIDVWDFGAEQLANTDYITYNNKLTEDIINGWFFDIAGVVAGTPGTAIPGDLVAVDADGNPEVVFDAGGKTNNRLRTTNTNLTRYDAKSLTDIEDSSIVYTGYVYSNSGKTDNVNVQVAVKAGDIVTVLVSSNGTASDIAWRSPSGVETVKNYSGKSSQAQSMTFYATEDGMYTLYSQTEKLVVARIYRERPATVTVSGTVTAPEGADLSNAKIVFENTTLGTTTEAPIVDGAYTVELSEQYQYALSLSGANGYIVDANNAFSIKNEEGNKTFNVNVIAVELVKVTGSLADLTATDAANVELTFTSDNVFVPEYTIDAENVTFSATFEKGVEYKVTESGVEDYTLDTTTVKVDTDGTLDIKFTKKPTYAINVTMEGVSATEASKAALTFTRLNDEFVADGYVYNFTGTEGIALRDGQYQVKAELAGYTQALTADVKVNGAAVDVTIVMEKGQQESVAYAAEITVGANGQYKTVNEALDAVRRMNRENGERVVISIEPGNYEEMLVIDVENVTLKNASSNPSIELTNKGVDIAEEAVRITSYYGHGYTYYSMGPDCKYDEELLAVNKANGYPSYVNPGSGTTDGSYWNATVVVTASGFEADGIIFENSFNQYMSEKAANDVIVKQSSAKEGTVARATMQAGDVTVQQKAYVERAAALAIYNNIYDVVFDNCKFVGRQDTLYGGTGTYAEFNDCSIYGGTDYIFGGMIAIFNKCDLVFNTSDDKNDVGYITAAQQKNGRGYLMYECHVTSTVPGVDTASTYTSKPGYFGRPWQADTSEVVFYNTTVDAADEHWINADSSTSKTNGASLIAAAGWDNSLSGTSAGMCEYGTVEASGVDNSASRATWATLLTSDVLADGTKISFDAYRHVVEVPVADYYEIDLTQGLKKGTTYPGGISVLEDMAFKAVAGDVIGGVTYTGYVAGSGNPKTDGANALGTVPDTGSVVILNAEKDGKVKFAIKLNSGKNAYFVDAASTEAVEGLANSTSASQFLALSYEVEAGHTYYFYGNGTKVPMYGITVDYREPEDWSNVAAPVLGSPVVDNAAGTITVPYIAQVGGIYADSIDIKMFSATNELVDTLSGTVEGNEGSLVFTPGASGTYTFQAVLRRSGEVNKNSGRTNAVNFILPMAQPVIISAENQGEGNVRFTWKSVAEADSYNVYVNGELKGTSTQPVYRFTGLTVGEEYEFGVEAVGNNDVSDRATVKQTITKEAVKNWGFSAFGSGVDTKNNNGSMSADGTITVASMSGKGKLVPASTDGLAYYYTTFDPENENFTIEADVTVDNWTYSNGQEGFGLMVADSIGENGDSSVFWNNSYMASVTKVEYFWDTATSSVSDAGDKYSMKLGVGSQEKIGATPENVANETVVSYFSSKMTTLETSAAQKNLGAGTYNIVGNYTNEGVDLGDIANQTTFHLKIQRNNTGYFVSYTDENGVTTTKKYYHGDEGDELTKFDPNNIYAGFFASRNAKITVTNVEISTIHPSKDAPAEERPITYVTPSYAIESSTAANSSDYEMVYYGNADGKLTITKADGTAVVKNQPVTAKEKFRVNVKLTEGKNTFKVTMVPNADYQPSKYEKLSSYNAKEFNFSVTYKRSVYKNVYISSNGKANATGTKGDPMDIYSAVRYANPGQKLILMEGTYLLDSTVTIDRGIDGTEAKRIYMIADPNASTRPVLNFQGKCAGMVIAGDYWYFNGFDVTKSSNGQKGIQVSGDNNVLDNLRAYDNGNTGIQISRFKGSDQWEDWPSDNLILNCTSYLNADAGYEDADGFAAKLTIADGNVFDGCIAAYNADDGWDLFAKVESGPIGKVIVRNSVAFKNGYDIDENGKEVNAGNGNGFKLGGSSISGYHTLENSIAFANKCKGIDSNSCPDIQVINSTSYDNESFNVAFYTNDAKNTDFSANGVLSFKTSNSVAENLKLKGSQDESKVYGITNYYFNGKKSVNSVNAEVSADWFANLDTAKAITGITRNANGTINMNGYLELTAAADANAGARIVGTPSAVITVEDEIIIPSVDVDDEDDDDDEADDVVVTPGQNGASTPSQNPSQGSSQRPSQNTQQKPAQKPAHKVDVKYDKLDLKAKAEVIAEVLKNALTDAVKEATGCETAEELLDYIVNVALEMSNQKGIKADKERTSVVEVTVMVEDETTGEFVPATEENFPEEGVDVTLPYPEGADKNDKFNIAHLVVLGCNGKTPGSMESVDYKATDDGLVAHIYSASPFIITWEEGAAESNTTVAETPATTEKAEVAADSTVVVEATAAAATAGTNVWGILIAVAAVAVVGLAVGVFVLRRKEDTLE